MEWIDGIALNEPHAPRAIAGRLPDLGRKVIQSFLRHALRDGLLPRRHASRQSGSSM